MKENLKRNGKTDYLGMQIRIVSNLLKRKIFDTKHMSEIQHPSGVQGMIVGYIYNNQQEKDIFQRDIELQFSIRRSTASKMLSRMQEGGLIQRNPVAHDARLKKITLTDKAMEIHKVFEYHVEELEKKMAYGLNQSELDSFFAVIEKIKQNLQ